MNIPQLIKVTHEKKTRGRQTTAEKERESVREREREGERERGRE